MSMCCPAIAGPRSGASRTSVRAVAVSRRTATTVAALQRFGSAVALLPPRIAVVVVPEALPEALAVQLHHRERVDPLGALPEVEVRHEQAGGAAVLRRQRGAAVLERDPRLAAAEVRHRQVGGVPAVAARHHE